ncbi:hypothetical protein T069G_01013 [Trichoderma breve]|uniref:2EXR domain-containing protein n=1 Tax=Trichoderma breve TaxID=2034170 RepID=A0A9W9ED54_9HYPO|nr:hypothetical protein T069G_01013 [Trichoderma breve]KAJ4864483.1 hypothetical protein T069G_01013 [Trichoderma breve]
MAQFLDLPFELRSTIWLLTIEPRTVEIRFEIDRFSVGQRRRARRFGFGCFHGGLSVLYVSSPTPVPAALHTCHEARSLLARHYQKAFTYGTEPRYVWANLDMDIISIGRSSLVWTEPEAPHIRRLKFARECDGHYVLEATAELGFFCNVQEIYVVCLDGPEAWYHPEDPFYWPCPRENVWLINTETNEMVTVAENHKRVERCHQEARRQEAEEEALQGLELAGAADTD